MHIATTVRINVDKNNNAQ